MGSCLSDTCSVAGLPDDRPDERASAKQHYCRCLGKRLVALIATAAATQGTPQALALGCKTSTPKTDDLLLLSLTSTLAADNGSVMWCSRPST
jgi:hypothetical protein